MGVRRKTVYLAIGIVGCGKGTQFGLLERWFGVERIGSSDLLRERAKVQDETGRLIKQKMDVFEYVSDDIMIGVVKERLLSVNRDCFSLDGFPRTYEQAKALVEELGRDFKIVPVLIEVDDETSEKQVFNRLALAEKENERRLASGLPLVEVREDDKTPEGRAKRRQIYRTSVAPMLDYLDSAVPGGVRRVDGMGGDIDTVYNRLLDVLEGVGAPVL